MKKTLFAVLALLLVLSFPVCAFAESYTVVRGDSMWKISVKYKIGLSEIISANPQIKNPALIYPGQVLSIPILTGGTTTPGGQPTGMTAFEEQVINLVNDIREKNGLKRLKANWELSRVARYKSQDMKDKGYFSHTSPTYGSPFKMMSDFGIRYSSAGENIAQGYKTPQAVVDAWMGSSGHRANILGASFTETGVGYVASGNYWTQMFIGR